MWVTKAREEEHRGATSTQYPAPSTQYPALRTWHLVAAEHLQCRGWFLHEHWLAQGRKPNYLPVRTRSSAGFKSSRNRGKSARHRAPRYCSPFFWRNSRTTSATERCCPSTA